MTDRDQQAFEELWRKRREEVTGKTSFGDHSWYALTREEDEDGNELDGYLIRNTQDAWIAFKAALALAAERRKQEEPFVWAELDSNGEIIRLHSEELMALTSVPLILRDKEQHELADPR